MRFRINEIGDDGLALNVPVTADWLAAAAPGLEARPGPGGLALRGRLSKSGDDFLLQGTLHGTIETTCGRCLEPARIPVDSPMTVTYVPGDDVEAKVEDDDPDVVVFPGAEIEIDDELRDEILLSIPLGPVCREGCRGLCPVCGGNRNLSPCDCEERQRMASSKFAALGKLKS